MLGGCGEMGSAAVADLVERPGHQVTIGDVRPDAAAALDGAEVCLNATYMRHNVPVTDAAIAAGAHLVDLGSYIPRRCSSSTGMRRRCAPAAGSCPAAASLPASPTSSPAWAPTGWTRSRASASSSYITHPLWTSPGIVVTRFDASSGSPARAVRPRRIRVLMELGFDCDEPFDVDGVAIAPRRFCRRLRRPARPRRG